VEKKENLETCTFLFEQSEDYKELFLSLVSTEPMTQEDFILALRDFIKSLEDGEVDFYGESSLDLH